MPSCPVCRLERRDYPGLAAHFYSASDASDVGHVMWLNRNLTPKKVGFETLTRLLRETLDLDGRSLKGWITGEFVRRFYGQRPHPFIVAFQRPSKAVLLGYTLEHQHFLRQWVRSCAYIAAKSNKADVTRYELENAAVEYLGHGGKPSHYELLLRMGESLGLRREAILASKPLPETAMALKVWSELARDAHWLEAMAALHSLELIASRKIKRYGASMSYFDPKILEDTAFPEAVREYLREGFESDADHSEGALDLVEKYAWELGKVEAVQAAFFRSIDAFDRYLMARLERAREFS